MSFEVRRFESGDGTQVRLLNELAMAATPEWVPGGPDEDLQDVPGHYLDGDGEFLVGVLDGDIVATGAYEPLEGWMAGQFPDAAADSAADATAAELTRMRVDPDHHRQGFGQRLYGELESRARADGWRELVLNTGAENRAARAFYEENGFEFVAERTVTFGGVTIDLALYRKRL